MNTSSGETIVRKLMTGKLFNGHKKKIQGVSLTALIIAIVGWVLKVAMASGAMETQIDLLKPLPERVTAIEIEQASFRSKTTAQYESLKEDMGEVKADQKEMLRLLRSGQ